MRLSTGANAGEREDQLQEQMAQLSLISTAELMEEVQEFCKSYQENRTALEEAFGSFETQASKEYIAAITSVMIDSCDIKTSPAAKEIVLRLTKLDIEREAAKCKVWPNTWNERFEYQPSQDGGYWVARNGPSGECGVVLVSTLKQHDDYSILWNYESQKIITNKVGDGFLLSCAVLDEESTLHTWQSVEHEIECDVFRANLNSISKAQYHVGFESEKVARLVGP